MNSRHRRFRSGFSVRITLLLLALVGAPQRPVVLAQAPEPAAGVPFAVLSEDDTREWLSYLASDALEGREVFTEGYGLAAAYVAGHLKSWGIEPLGDDGTFLQRVAQRGYRVTRNSTLTIDVNGESRTFKDGDHVSFPLESGGKQTLTFRGVEFVGYGQPTPDAGRPAGDFTGRDVSGRLVAYLPGGRGMPSAGRGATADRSHEIIRNQKAGAVLTFEPSRPPSSGSGKAPQAEAGGAASGAGAAAGRGGGALAPEFVTVERVDARLAPAIVADEAVLEWLFARGPVPFGQLRAKFEKGEPLPGFSLPDVTVTIAVDQTYTVVSTDFTQNVVGLVRGSDPVLRDTYVFFGAHLDHVGYARTGQPKGPVNVPVTTDPIWNGADDDASGSAALMAIARAFAAGPKPRRSVVFIWHAGEEAGLLGSRYMADFPVVPLDRVQASFNIDMIGRNRDDKPSEANTLYVIGADRISTDLHNLLIATNATLARPLTLDFEFNDPSDVNTFYTRSDHYTYATKGIPVAFFFTGTHDDYHANTDSADKILFPKLIRIADLVYRTGFSVADSDRVLERDQAGPRAGRGFSGRLPTPAH
ncbi:MAG: M20/M25/M40 family metallo-hydrolase [Acidobacteria bacterium]|nr:M20/M25/M40 family metallo-hydrolase [Acidobacteriota bacterium]